MDHSWKVASLEPLMYNWRRLCTWHDKDTNLLRYHMHMHESATAHVPHLVLTCTNVEHRWNMAKQVVVRLPCDYRVIRHLLCWKYACIMSVTCSISELPLCTHTQMYMHSVTQWLENFSLCGIDMAIRIAMHMIAVSKGLLHGDISPSTKTIK